MVEEYGGTATFSRLIIEAAANVFLSAEKALQELPLTRSLGKTTVTFEPVGVAGLITPWNANSFFLSAKLASALAAGCTAVIKPSELSAMQTQAWLECVHEAKLPKGRKAASIPLASIVAEPLARHLAARRSVRPRVPYLFTSEKGHALRRSVFTRKTWHKFRTDHGLPYMVPHQLRHTTGTLLKALGVPIEVVKEILRHASVETTDRFYQDEIPALQSDALAKLSTLLRG